MARALEAAVRDAATDYPGFGLRLDVGVASVPADAPSLEAAVAVAESRMPRQ